MSAAEEAGFGVFLTADQGIKNEQNLPGRKLARVALGSNRWSIVKPPGPEIADHLNAAKPGTFQFIEFPGRSQAAQRLTQS